MSRANLRFRVGLLVVVVVVVVVAVMVAAGTEGVEDGDNDKLATAPRAESAAVAPRSATSMGVTR